MQWYVIDWTSFQVTGLYNVFITLLLFTDLYAFIIGSYVIWTAVAGVRYSIEQIRKRRSSVLFGQLWKWCGILVKSSALLSIWVRMIPLADHVTKADPLILHRSVFAFKWLIHLFLVTDICYPSANWASFWAFGHRANESSSGWKSSIPPLSRLGIRPYISQDMD